MNTIPYRRFTAINRLSNRLQRPMLPATWRIDYALKIQILDS